jgi:septal ring factor EnvC (AmiA/AmiB activator)
MLLDLFIALQSGPAILVMWVILLPLTCFVLARAFIVFPAGEIKTALEQVKAHFAVQQEHEKKLDRHEDLLVRAEDGIKEIEGEQDKLRDRVLLTESDVRYSKETLDRIERALETMAEDLKHIRQNGHGH